MTELTPIILCADDFGLNAETSAGILQLLEMKRLSSVSCMSNSPAFSQYAPQLMAYKGQVKIGLHFNLTEGEWLSQQQQKGIPFSLLIARSYFRFLTSTQVTDELQSQLTRFKETLGFLPDYIDGHQHIHQFPVIRDAILKLHRQQLKESNVAIRSTYPTISDGTQIGKTMVLAILGGRTMRRRLQREGIKHNPYFSGVYSLSPTVPYRTYFRQWLQHAKPDTLIVCHPGLEGAQENAMSAVRFNEWNYFASEDFVEDCEEYKVQLSL